jgi:hypothetical protein
MNTALRNHRIIKAHLAGASLVDQAAHWGLTRQMIHRIIRGADLRGNGSRGRPWRERIEATAKRNKRIADLAKGGMTFREIVEISGLAETTCRSILRRMGVSAARPPIKGFKIDESDVRELWRVLRVPFRQRGETWDQLAKRFGISKPLIGAINRGRCWTHVTGLPKRRAATSAECERAANNFVRGSIEAVSR